MTIEEGKRRASLDFGDDDIGNTTAPPIDPKAVRAATRAAGFRETPKAQEPIAALPVASRRARRKTGRTEQFATRLRADTLEAIYAYADRHQITLAETIERAISVLASGDRS